MAWLLMGFGGLTILILCSFFNVEGVCDFSKSSGHHYFVIGNCSNDRLILGWVLFLIFHPLSCTTCFVLLVMGLGPRLFDFSS
jgi:hypothetical protein